MLSGFLGGFLNWKKENLGIRLERLMRCLLGWLLQASFMQYYFSRKNLRFNERELKLQRKTLEATEVEIRGQKEQLQAQNQTLQKQNFESSFFQLLSMHSEIVNSMEMPRENLSGRECFRSLLRNLKNSLEIAIAQGRSKTEVFNAIYEKEFFSIFQPYVGHYFRHLYNVVKFVHEHEFFHQKEFKEKKRYTNFIRAQLSSNELGVLFYNCLSDRGAKFKDLVEKYAFFEDMPSEVLIDEEHRTLYAAIAYGESD